MTMKRKTRTILEELNSLYKDHNKSAIIESRAIHIIDSAINLVNIIANDGDSYTPHINIDFASTKKNVSYKKSVFKEIKQGMSDAVYKEGGTAYNINISDNNVKVYGKTGTAQLCANCDIEPHAWFAGLIQLKDGKSFSICVLIENGGKGSNLSTKIAKKIFNYILGENV